MPFELLLTILACGESFVSIFFKLAILLAKALVAIIPRQYSRIIRDTVCFSRSILVIGIR